MVRLVVCLSKLRCEALQFYHGAVSLPLRRLKCVLVVSRESVCSPFVGLVLLASERFTYR